jgi:acetyltransferase-like isoleucine patch superfamily enzyme
MICGGSRGGGFGEALHCSYRNSQLKRNSLFLEEPMAISEYKIYPRSNDSQTVYLKNVITDPGIEVGDYTIYNDFAKDPTGFQHNNVLYYYPVNHDRLEIGKFCSIACGAKFIFKEPLI